ncbi:chemotaxis protein CheB [Sediminicurvatus halobius]|uniref:protein-glutamate methylesterase n=1 Tax=Sediminicurvatus halobius TaxID=2182432 RepID=A0A2U2MYX1_9GAMM|nr:chemotaxis protein CheB [Spiribacter halobius]PWG61993.1 hypothetical protein DEM34_14125 [Spiribacter halobius]UEX78400.1 chemotaxis protein CheB [Spiribacter halobius]
MGARAPEPPLRLALLGSRPADRARLRAQVAAAGPVEFVCDCRISALPPSLPRGCDALLVDLTGADDAELDALDRVVGQRPEPMLFVDSQAGDAGWRVHAKLQDLLAVSWRQEGAAPEPDAQVSVWVIGASFGGPQMLKRLLGALPQAPAAAVVIAQHIGAGFADALAAELQRVCPLPVCCAAPGLHLEPGQAYVMPVEHRLILDLQGRFAVGEPYPAERVERPCIDEVMTLFAGHYAARCGGIVLSGMGDDGARGADAIHRAGGPVWVQAPESCAVDSMPLAVRQRVPAAGEAAPEALAALLGSAGGAHENHCCRA